jgi:arylsulfatase A-like enzyme
MAFVVLAASGCGCGEQSSDSPGQTSVVFITLDTTRADALSCYGNPKRTTPRLDALAARGTLFHNAMAQASVTPVSHASIFTGQNPYTHGLRVLHGVKENRLPESAVTLGEVLLDAGYRTGAFLSAFPVTTRFGLQQGFESFDEDFLDAANEMTVTEQGIISTGLVQRRADETTDRAIQWLEATADEPFFLWVHYFDPHDPALLPPQEFMRKFGRPPTDTREKLRAVYEMEVTYMDQELGRLLEAVDGSMGLGNVIVVVVADHGEGLGQHDWWTHGKLYQEQIRVPLIVHVPGMPEGLETRSLVRTIDIMPTVLEAAGIELSRWPTMEGRSLLPLLRGETDTERHAYSESVNMLFYQVMATISDNKDDMLFAVIDRDWKYVHHLLREDESELFHLLRDPAEETNLYSSNPEEVERMRALLRATDFVPEVQPNVAEMSPEDIARLKALGYVANEDDSN